MKFSKFFSYMQDTNWYREFLNPVIDEIGNQSRLLDVGTGTGKLFHILSTEKNINCVGIDTASSMLEEAKKKLSQTNVSLQKIEINKKFPFENNSFDNITICNLLFVLNEEANGLILSEVNRVLKKGGKLVVLTPTGRGNLRTLVRKYYSLMNVTIYFWFFMTKNQARLWHEKQQLITFSKNNNLTNSKKITFQGFAQIEVLIK